MIAIRNIYYMLSYAFQVLNEQGYRSLATEEFENTGELCAAILVKGLSRQLKRGLGREYLPKSEPLSTVRGKMDIADSIKTNALLNKQVVCTYDDFSVNSYMNRIIKSTMVLLLHSDISKARKQQMRKLMVYLSDVDTLDLYTVDWNFRYNRNNQTYRMLISICYLVVKGLLQSQQDGATRLMEYFDEQRMCRLYEKFILEYYRRHYPMMKVNPSQISWQLDDGVGDMLPVMKTDIMLTYNVRVLIIDAKYYSKTTQQQYGVNTLHSGNLYQIFTYVKNKEWEMAGEKHAVSGMLLYAKTDEMILPNNDYWMSGNRISVRTLDLDCEFREIAGQLDGIVGEEFGESIEKVG